MSAAWGLDVESILGGIVCRDVTNWRRVKDEQNFAWSDRRPTSARIQLLTCSHGDAVLVATQGEGDSGPSLINDAEEVVRAATRALLPWRMLNPPEMVILMIEQNRELLWSCAEFSFPQQRLTAGFVSSAPWEPLVVAHAELDRGSGFVPRQQEREPWTNVWFSANLTSITDVRPFRAFCLAVERKFSTRMALRLRRGQANCCWYHRCDWRRAAPLAIDQLRIAHQSGEPAADAASAIEGMSLASTVQDAALSLLNDPIHVSTRGWLGNGQHRVRAMLDQGVRQAPATRTVHDDDLADALASPSTYLVCADDLRS